MLEPVDDGSHTHAAPDGEGIEGAGIGVVTLTGLHRCLVQINHDGQTSHEEEEEYYPELADANGIVNRILRAINHHFLLAGVPSLPEEA